jgi:ketosteroid isomerase-like protein
MPSVKSEGNCSGFGARFCARASTVLVALLVPVTLFARQSSRAAEPTLCNRLSLPARTLRGRLRNPTDMAARAPIVRISLIIMGAICSCSAATATAPQSDREEVARLDTQFQAAVKRNDAETMARILHADMVLILGDGRINTRAEQLQEARDKVISYEVQDEDPGTQTVRVHGDTAIVTARLRIRGTTGGKSFDRRLWFSDVYVRTPSGWKYFFGQASLYLPTPATS